MSMHCFKRK